MSAGVLDHGYSWMVLALNVASIQLYLQIGATAMNQHAAHDRSF